MTTKQFVLTEEEHNEYIYLKSMRKHLNKQNKVKNSTTLMCNICGHSWTRHTQISDKECASLVCDKCKITCFDDVRDIK